jgi:CheY-like chemotaxis protein
MVVDDDPVHRDLVRELLEPLGFNVVAAADGAACLSLADECRPNLILLDVSMPGMDGWTVARLLRQSKRERPAIIMLSALTMEKEREFEPDRAYDDYMIKPLDLRQMLKKFHTLLDVKWTTGAAPDATPPPPIITPQAGNGPPLGEIEALIQLGQIGHVSGINAKLAEIEANSPEHGAFVKDLRVIVDSFKLGEFLTVLEAQRSHHAP